MKNSNKEREKVYSWYLILNTNYFYLVNFFIFGLLLYSSKICFESFNEFGSLPMLILPVIVFFICIFWVKFLYDLGKHCKEIEIQKTRLTILLGLIIDKNCEENLKYFLLSEFLVNPEYYTTNKQLILNIIENFEDLELKGSLLDKYYKIEDQKNKKLENKEKQDTQTLDFDYYLKLLKDSNSNEKEIEHASRFLIEQKNLSKETIYLLLEKNLDEKIRDLVLDKYKILKENNNSS